MQKLVSWLISITCYISINVPQLIWNAIHKQVTYYDPGLVLASDASHFLQMILCRLRNVLRQEKYSTTTQGCLHTGQDDILEGLGGGHGTLAILCRGLPHAHSWSLCKRSRQDLGWALFSIQKTSDTGFKRVKAVKVKTLTLTPVYLLSEIELQVKAVASSKDGMRTHLFPTPHVSMHRS